MGNCRWAPTCNAETLHIGHLYGLLVNRDEAAAMGGKLIVRWDDGQVVWKKLLGEETIARNRQAMRDDIEWCQIEATYTSEAEEHDANVALWKGKIDDRFLVDNGEYPHVPYIAGEPRPYPYTSALTALKVAQDYREGVTKVIRGMDLCDEYALSCYFCELLGVPVIPHFYIPRLKEAINVFTHTEVVELADISKSNPGGTDWSIRAMREKYNAPALIQKLADVCLKDRHEPWTVDNLRRSPIVRKGEW